MVLVLYVGDLVLLLMLSLVAPFAVPRSRIATPKSLVFVLVCLLLILVVISPICNLCMILVVGLPLAVAEALLSGGNATKIMHAAEEAIDAVLGFVMPLCSDVLY